MSACFFICIAAFGQTEKGTWLIGGGLSLNTGQGNGQFSFNPTAGNFVANNFVLGGKINIDYSKQGSIKSFGLGVGPFARYYIGASTTRPFVVTEFGYQNLNTKNTTK